MEEKGFLEFIDVLHEDPPPAPAAEGETPAEEAPAEPSPAPEGEPAEGAAAAGAAADEVPADVFYWEPELCSRIFETVEVQEDELDLTVTEDGGELCMFDEPAPVRLLCLTRPPVPTQ